MSGLLAPLLVACSLLFMLLLSTSGQELLAANGHHEAARSAVKANEEDQAFITLARNSLSNVTGTYRGSWRKTAVPGESQHSPPILAKNTGAVFYRLKSTLTDTEGVQDVQGELVVRDGDFHTEEDITMYLSGVYVLESRRLHAVLDPPALQQDLQPSDYREQSLAYRQALRDVAHEWTKSPDDPTLSEFLDSPIEQKAPRLRKRCEFVLDLGVSAPLPGRQPTIFRRALLQDALGSKGSEDLARMQDVVMNGTLHSENCGVALELNATSTHLDVYHAKAINYTLMITSLSFLQVLLLLRQMEATSTQALMSKVSMLTIGQQAIMDAYLCLLHLTTGIMIDPLFNTFATAAFFEFVIFAIFEMRYLLTIWRARRSSNLDPWQQQRELSIMYARFYSALLGGIFISYQMQRWMKYMVFGLFSFWVPQIVLCAYQDAKQPLKAYYVVGMSLTRMALPLYLYSCPQNLLRNPTSATLCILLSVYMCLQVAVLMGQSWLGPRFFIPKRFLPPRYDYHRPATARQPCGGGVPGDSLSAGDIETGDAGVECVICMNPVDAATARERMVTPCNHFFHEACLERWMLVKMECPTCRSVLPPS